MRKISIIGLLVLEFLVGCSSTNKGDFIYRQSNVETLMGNKASFHIPPGVGFENGFDNRYMIPVSKQLVPPRPTLLPPHINEE